MNEPTVRQLLSCKCLVSVRCLFVHLSVCPICVYTQTNSPGQHRLGRPAVHCGVRYKYRHWIVCTCDGSEILSACHYPRSAQGPRQWLPHRRVPEQVCLLCSTWVARCILMLGTLWYCGLIQFSDEPRNEGGLNGCQVKYERVDKKNQGIVAEI